MDIMQIMMAKHIGHTPNIIHLGGSPYIPEIFLQKTNPSFSVGIHAYMTMNDKINMTDNIMFKVFL